MESNDIKNEIRAQVEFKLNDILSHIKARVSSNWINAANTGSLKHTHYWEAFQELENIFNKEINMPTPYDQMFNDKFRKVRDESIENLTSKLLKRGERDFFIKEKIITNEIKKAMRGIL